MLQLTVDIPDLSIKMAKFVKWSHLHVTVPCSRDASQHPSVDHPPPREFLKKKLTMFLSKPSDCLLQRLKAPCFVIFLAAIKALDTIKEECLHFFGGKWAYCNECNADLADMIQSYVFFHHHFNCHYLQIIIPVNANYRSLVRLWKKDTILLFSDSLTSFFIQAFLKYMYFCFITNRSLFSAKLHWAIIEWGDFLT